MTDVRFTSQEEQALTPFWGAVVRYGLAITTVIFYVITILHFSYTPDSTYIYLQYAKNIAQGDGFSFNAGVPSLGVASPLWTFLISFGAVLKLDPYVVAKTFDLVFASIAIIQIFVLGYVILKDKVFAVMAAVIFSLDAWFLMWSGTGMEASLAVLLTILAVSYTFRNEYLVASFVCGVLTLVRPEGLLLFVVVQADNFLNSTDSKAALKSGIIALGMYVGVLTPWLIFSYFQFGSVVSSTFLIKSSEPISVQSIWNSVVESIQVLTESQLVLLLLLVVGLVEAWRSKQWQMRRVELFPVLWMAALIFFYSVQRVRIDSSFLVPTVPLVIIYGLWGLKRIAESWRLPAGRAIYLLLFVTALTVFQNQMVYHKQLVPRMKNFTAGMNYCFKPMGYWLRTYAAPDAKVFVVDPGMLGYISEKNIYDANGVIAPAVRKSFEGLSYDEGMLNRRYESVVSPDYVVDRALSRDRLRSEDMKPIMSGNFPEDGPGRTDTVFYTLYKVIK